ncbi:hypothetical protein DSECCO2_334470 [anaerobic digester metagenome]
MILIFLITIIVVLLTRIPFANAFFNNTRSIVISFCVFLGIDVLRWTLDDAETQSRRQDIGWSIGVVMFMVYFLWQTWDDYSLWQVWLVALVCVVLGIGLLVRLYSKWDVDCVCWSTWAICCLSVSMGIVISILVWNPMTLKEAEELTIASEGDSSFAFRHIDAWNKSTKAPLGYYLFNQKQPNGSWGTHGTGRAVVYLGENHEHWRSSTPHRGLMHFIALTVKK